MGVKARRGSHVSVTLFFSDQCGAGRFNMVKGRFMVVAFLGCSDFGWNWLELVGIRH